MDAYTYTIKSFTLEITNCTALFSFMINILRVKT